MTDPVIRAAQQVAWDEGYQYSESHFECDLRWGSGDTCYGCPTCKPINPYRGQVASDDCEIRVDATATAVRDLLAQFVRSPDTRRRLTHMVRLAKLNGHDDTADTLQLIIELATRTRNPYSHSHKRIEGVS